MMYNTDIINQYLLLDELSIPELVKFAREIGIKNVNKMNKKTIENEIKNKLNIE